MTKIGTSALVVALSLSLAACSGAANTNSAASSAAAETSAVVGAENGDAGTGTEKTADLATLMAEEPADATAAAQLYQALMAQENAVLSTDAALWEKVFMSADKDSSMIEDGADYGDYLLKAIDDAKAQFSEEELETLKAAAEKIKEIEGKLTTLEQTYPDCGTQADDSMSVGAADMEAGSANVGSSGMTGDSVNAAEAGMTSDADAMKFPSFEGQDLDGNAVDSSTLFSGNTVTVVNFWFTTCKPCVGELPDLEALHQELAKKGGAVIGINAFTLDGSVKDMNEAKSVLEQQGVSYQNIWFASNSDAGIFTAGLYAFPTTYVVDRNGSIVGDPIVGAISSDAQMKKLNALIDQAMS